MDIHYTIILSGSNFYQNIMDKYGISKMNSFRFPSMILFKNKRNFSLQKINLDIFMKFFMNNRNIESSAFFSKNVNHIKKIYSWWFEKFLQKYILKSYSLKISRIEKEQLIMDTLRIISGVLTSRPTPVKKISAISSIQPVFSKVENNIAIAWNTTIYPLFSSPSAVFRPLVNHNVSRLDKTLNYMLMNPDYHMQITKMQGKSSNSSERTEGIDISIQTNPGQYQYIHEHTTSVILPPVVLVLNNRIPAMKKDILNRTFQNYTTIFNGTLKYHTSPVSAPDSYVKKKIIPGAALYFHNHRNIEEIEEIKRTVSETKKAVLEASIQKSSSRDMDVALRRHLDLDRISNQVYQNIERRIRTERERRGL
ncbi:MAG TPA: hypothetical protein VER35_01385 [Candidatus Limnocylindrales bacterium]|nr:hypothetical protein [Candidatus Limnocylindrales bacterium]